MKTNEYFFEVNQFFPYYSIEAIVNEINRTAEDNMQKY